MRTVANLRRSMAGVEVEPLVNGSSARLWRTALARRAAAIRNPWRLANLSAPSPEAVR